MRRNVCLVVLLFLLAGSLPLAACGSASTGSSTPASAPVAADTARSSPTAEPSSGLTSTEAAFKRNARKLLSAVEKGNLTLLAALRSSNPDYEQLSGLVVDSAALNASWRTPTSPSQRMTSLFGMCQQCGTAWESVCADVGEAADAGEFDGLSKLSRSILKGRAALAGAQAALGEAEWDSSPAVAKLRAQVAKLRKNGALDDMDLNSALALQTDSGALNDTLDAVNAELANVLATITQ
jgi:hypothetical protein